MGVPYAEPPLCGFIGIGQLLAISSLYLQNSVLALLQLTSVFSYYKMLWTPPKSWHAYYVKLIALAGKT
jgi:hypothetical protein